MLCKVLLLCPPLSVEFVNLCHINVISVQGVYFKLRRMVPCAIGNVRFLVEMPEPEEMQISLVGKVTEYQGLNFCLLDFLVTVRLLYNTSRDHETCFVSGIRRKILEIYFNF